MFDCKGKKAKNMKRDVFRCLNCQMCSINNIKVEPSLKNTFNQCIYTKKLYFTYFYFGGAGLCVFLSEGFCNTLFIW